MSFSGINASNEPTASSTFANASQTPTAAASGVASEVPPPPPASSSQAHITSSKTNAATTTFPKFTATGTAAASHHSSTKLSTLIPAIVVPIIVVLIAIGALLILCRRRNHRRKDGTFPTSEGARRFPSMAYRKAELTGDLGTARFDHEGKPELGMHGREVSGAGRSNSTNELPASTVGAERPHTSNGIEVANQSDPISRPQPVYVPQPSARSAQNEELAPKYAVSTNGDDIDKLRDEERRLAREIDAHESLQRLRGERAAVLERIRLAEEHAARERRLQ